MNLLPSMLLMATEFNTPVIYSVAVAVSIICVFLTLILAELIGWSKGSKKNLIGYLISSAVLIAYTIITSIYINTMPKRDYDIFYYCVITNPFIYILGAFAACLILTIIFFIKSAKEKKKGAQMNKRRHTTFIVFKWVFFSLTIFSILIIIPLIVLSYLIMSSM